MRIIPRIVSGLRGCQLCPQTHYLSYQPITTWQVWLRPPESLNLVTSVSAVIPWLHHLNNCDSSSSCAGLHSILCLHLISISHLGIFSGIIGELYGNNRKVIREIQNRILGTIMGIIGSGLPRRGVHAYSSAGWNFTDAIFGRLFLF